MAAPTIQQILKPTRLRALDTSNSEQIVGNQLLGDPEFTTAVSAGSSNANTWRCEDSHLEITGGKAVWTAYTGSEDRRLVDNVVGPFIDVTARYRVRIEVSDYTQGALKVVSGSYSSGFEIDSVGTFIFDMSPATGAGNFHIIASTDSYSGGDAVIKVSEITIYKLEDRPNANHAQIYSGRALEFDGVADYLECFTALETTHPFFVLENDFTVALWLKVNTAGDDTVFYATNNDNSSRVGLNVGAEGEIAFTTWNGSVYTHASGGGNDEKIINTSTWYRVVCTCSNNTLKLYLNGILQTGTSTAHSSNLASTNSNRLRIGEKNSVYFDGCLSDFQVWNSVFSQDEVTYDYLNPEQLALNRGGSSLTNSNLKLWYPMNDGHRGKQDYILDASNTGLGDIMETTTGTTNAYMSEDTGWLIGGFDDGDTTIPVDGSNEKAFYTTDKYVTGGRSLYVKTVSTDSNENIFAQYNFVAGTTYKFFARVWVVDQGNGQMPGLYQSNGQFQNNIIKFPTAYGEWQELEMIMNCDSTGVGNNQIGGSGSGKTLEFYLDEYWVKPINDKHNATTTFYGDELVTNSTFETSSANWTLVYSGGSGSGASIDAANTSSPLDGSKDLKIVNTSAGENAGAVSNGISFIAGRTYQVSYKYKASDTGCKGKIGHLNDSTGGAHIGGSVQQDLNNTTETDHSYTFTSTETETNYVTFIVPDGVTLQVDNVSVKEVGVASGWTDANQQLDIPQLALQSYSQLSFFDGNNLKYQDASGFTPGDFTTVCFAFYLNQVGSSTGLFDCIDWSGGTNFRIYMNTGNKIMCDRLRASAATEGFDTTILPALEAGKWYHTIWTIPKTAGDNNWKVMINGEEYIDSTTHNMPVSSRTIHIGQSGGLGTPYLEGSITELAVYSDALSDDEKQQLYNNGKIADATTVGDNLVRYWRNKGNRDWVNIVNPGSNTATITNTSNLQGWSNMLITAGADSSRDSQGFLMNRQRETNCLNFPFIDYANNGDVNTANFVTVEGTIGTERYESPWRSPGYDVTGFSFECWFKAEMKSEPMFLVCHQESSNSGEGFHVRWSGANTIYAVISDGTNQASAEVSGSLFTNVSKWYHIVVSWDHTNKKKYVYIDGILRQVETESSMGVISPNADIEIGSRRGEGSQGWVGQIDDVKLYNRILTDGGVTTGQSDGNALSTAAKGEVLRNYNAGKRSHK